MNKHIGSSFDEFLVEASALTDEQGDYWPDWNASIARVRNYAGDPSARFNGMLVQVDWFDFESDLFECFLVEDPMCPVALLCKADELFPVNDYTKALLDVMPISCGPPEKIVILRKLLLKAKKDVPHDVIAEWNADVQAAAYFWAMQSVIPLSTARPDPIIPPMPSELKPY